MKDNKTAQLFRYADYPVGAPHMNECYYQYGSAAKTKVETRNVLKQTALYPTSSYHGYLKKV